MSRINLNGRQPACSDIYVSKKCFCPALLTAANLWSRSKFVGVLELIAGLQSSYVSLQVWSSVHCKTVADCWGRHLCKKRSSSGKAFEQCNVLVRADKPASTLLLQLAVVMSANMLLTTLFWSCFSYWCILEWGRWWPHCIYQCLQNPMLLISALWCPSLCAFLRACCR